jgi:UDP:flavonoid glycosyltransferase YjiC (YdhE family)
MVCLLPNCAYLSETSRMLEIYRALLAKGAEVCVATHGGPHEAQLRNAGVPYTVVGPRMSGERITAFVRSGIGMGHPGQSMYSDEELRTYAKAEAAFFKEKGVKVAVTGFTLTTLLSTRIAGIPLVTEHAGSYVPPVLERGLMPAPSTPVNRTFGFLPAPIVKILMNKGAPRLQHYTYGFNRVAKELGVAEIPSMPALLLGDLTLVTDVPEVLGISERDLEAWRPDGKTAYRPETRLRYAGPIFAHLDAPMPERVERLLSSKDKVIYVAITSSPAQLVREVVKALKPLEAKILVAGTVHDLADLEDAQVMIEGVLPSHLIMPRVALAVTAGGQGSVQSAMASGLPLIGIPLQPEQDLNVVLLEKLGAARRIAPKLAGSAQMTQLAQQMLTSSKAKAAAQKVQGYFAKVDGPTRAAEAIIGLLKAVPAKSTSSQVRLGEVNHSAR